MKPEFHGFSTPRLDRRKFLLGLSFGSAAAFAAMRQPDVRIDYLGKEKLEGIVPKTIGRWSYVAASGLVVPPEDQLVQATYSQLLTRVYWDNQGPPIMLLLAQSGSQTGFLQIHRPETCYTASGYAISELTPHAVPVLGGELQTNYMEAMSSEGRNEHVLYWTRVGDQMPRSWREQRLAVAMDNIKGVIPDAILARVSVVSPNKDAAIANLNQFIASFVASISRPMRRVFIA